MYSHVLSSDKERRRAPENEEEEKKKKKQGDMDLLRSRILPVIALIASVLFLYLRAPSTKVSSLRYFSKTLSSSLSVG